MKTPMQIIKDLIDNNVSITSVHVDNLLEKEKQMIVDAVCQHDIRNHSITSSSGILYSVKQAEQYYDDTFKNE